MTRAKELWATMMPMEKDAALQQYPDLYKLAKLDKGDETSSVVTNLNSSILDKVPGERVNPFDKHLPIRSWPAPGTKRLDGSYAGYMAGGSKIYPKPEFADQNYKTSLLTAFNSANDVANRVRNVAGAAVNASGTTLNSINDWLSQKIFGPRGH